MQKTYIDLYDTKWHDPKTTLEDWNENDWNKQLATCIDASLNDLSTKFTGLKGLDLAPCMLLPMPMSWSNYIHF